MLLPSAGRLRWWWMLHRPGPRHPSTWPPDASPTTGPLMPEGARASRERGTPDRRLPAQRDDVTDAPLAGVAAGHVLNATSACSVRPRFARRAEPDAHSPSRSSSPATARSPRSISSRSSSSVSSRHPVQESPLTELESRVAAAVAVGQRGDLRRAAEDLSDVLVDAYTLLEPDDPMLLRLRYSHAAVTAYSGRVTEAIELLRAVVEDLDRSSAPTTQMRATAERCWHDCCSVPERGARRARPSRTCSSSPDASKAPSAPQVLRTYNLLNYGRPGPAALRLRQLSAARSAESCGLLSGTGAWLRRRRRRRSRRSRGSRSSRAAR